MDSVLKTERNGLIGGRPERWQVPHLAQGRRESQWIQERDTFSTVLSQPNTLI